MGEVSDVDLCAGKLGIPSSKVMSLERTLSPAAFLKAAEEKVHLQGSRCIALHSCLHGGDREARTESQRSGEEDVLKADWDVGRGRGRPHVAPSASVEETLCGGPDFEERAMTLESGNSR